MIFGLADLQDPAALQVVMPPTEAQYLVSIAQAPQQALQPGHTIILPAAVKPSLPASAAPITLAFLGSVTWLLWKFHKQRRKTAQAGLSPARRQTYAG